MPWKKTAASARTESKAPRRPSRHATKEGGIPEIYQEMLVEAAASTPSLAKSEGRAPKRRRVEEPLLYTLTPDPDTPPTEAQEDGLEIEQDSELTTRAPQIIYDDFASSDESEADFEDVDLERGLERGDGEAVNKKPLKLDLTQPSGRPETPPAQRRKPATTAEKRLRLDVHKWHVLCLMLHGQHRNRWCDDEEVQAILKPLIPRKLIALLHLDESKPQHARNHGFNKAIEEISDIWQHEWTITANGVRRAFWTEDPNILRDIDDLEDPVDLNDFKEAAKTMSGSRDLGAQLFCALLRSLAVETRLVFSLQPLPFSGVAKGVTPEKPRPQYIYASRGPFNAPAHDTSTSGGTATSSNPRWRASEYTSEEQAVSTQLTTPRSSKKRIKDSPFPIFWVEVFSPSITKWISVDPLVRHTFNKPRTGYEPAASDRLNSMSYVIAFEDDDTAKDVTRRYASQVNAKTRKVRVESTKGGEKWWRRTMDFFRRPFPEARDEVENDELTARAAQEGMPKSIVDFKGHPIFALERHLRRNEVIYPLREAGKISAGAVGKVESVYRQKDVHVVRSADQWYRKGRDVKEGEQPLKRAATTRRSNRNTPMDEDEVGEGGTGLYAQFQTDVYFPPPALHGKVPRNAYGNLDVYVPSMIPAGAIHLQHPVASRAARILGIDSADAVTGFDFKGRQGTAVVNGIVTAAEYRESLVEVIRGMERDQADAEEAKRTHVALQMWRRFMTALRIKEKIEKEYADADADSDEATNDQKYNGSESGDDEMGGGFLADADMEEPDAFPSTALSAPDAAPQPFVASEIIVIESPHQLEKPGIERIVQEMTRFDSLFDEADAKENGGGSLTEEIANEEGRGFVPEEDDTGEGGGFIPDTSEDGQDGGGGFVPEDHPSELETTSGQRLDLALGIRSTPDAEQVEADAESPIRTAPARGGTPLAAVPSPRDTVSTSAGDIVAETSKGRPASSSETSLPDVEKIASRRTSDSMDNESLLSHDPEDEDAEPEWLIDDEEP